MPRSWYDFGNINSAVGGKEIDNSELLYMLRGIGLVDNLGRTVFYDDFHSGLFGWSTSKSGAGLVPDIFIPGLVSTIAAWGDNINIRLTPGVVANDTSMLWKASYLMGQFTLGIEIGTMISNPMCIIDLSIEHKPKGMATKMGTVRVKQNTETIELLTDIGYVIVGTFIRPVLAASYRVQIKLVCDFQTAKYKRLFFNEVSYDVSGYNLNIGASAIEGVCIAKCSGVSFGAGSSIVSIGYMRLSKDEP